MSVPDKRKTRNPGQDRDEAAEQLRQLIREAHEAVKDLRAGIRDAEIIARNARDLAWRAAEDQIDETIRFLQSEQNRHQVELNEAITQARKVIVDALTLTRLVPDDDFKTMRVEWAGVRFDDHAGGVAPGSAARPGAGRE